MHNVLERITLEQIHLKSHECLGNWKNCFHKGATIQEISSKALRSQMMIRQSGEDLFMKAKEDHLLNQARSELMKQEHLGGSLNSCINELQQQAFTLRDSDCRTLTKDIWNLEENNLVYTNFL